MSRMNRMIVSLILAVLLSLPSAVLAGKTIGKITRLKGRVTVYRDGAKIGISAKNGMMLQQNDRIKTRKKAYLRFKLNDGSIMTLGQKAELTLDRFTYNPEKKERVALFKVALGKLRIFANRMLKYRDNRFQVKTPTAVAGVRGTVFMVWVASETDTIIACFDSAVEVASVFKTDEKVVLTKNILTSVGKGGPPSKPVLMTEEHFKAFQGDFGTDIKPVDSETGFKDDKDGSGEDDQRTAPDPTVIITEPPYVEPPVVINEDPMPDPAPEPGPGPEPPEPAPEPAPGPAPEPEPEIILPEPPAVLPDPPVIQPDPPVVLPDPPVTPTLQNLPRPPAVPMP